ncbi:MAG: DUF2088 domain-containing protein [Oscillospiraceae bacterium]|nr:DUF2088 domain-containing protein [Oscillospiraceae bacterium]
MSILNLKYGNGVVTLNVRNAAQLQKFDLPKTVPLTDAGSEFVNAASYRCSGSLGLHYLISPNDLITVVIRENRYLPVAETLYMLTYYLHSLGVPYENITVLAKADTQGASVSHLLPPQLNGLIKAEAHHCDDSNLVSVGTTSHGIPVLVNPLLTGRKVIILDSIQRDVLTGFSGGPECLLGLCGRSTIEKCFSQAIQGNTLPAQVRSGIIVGNPLCNEMTEISRFINPAFAVYTITDAKKHFCRFACGGWLDAWYEGCNAFQQLFGIPVSGQYDIVIASCGGAPYDATLYAACRSLFHAVQFAKEGGTVILAAEGREGGPDQFINGQEPLASLYGLTYFGFQDLVKKYRVLIQSKINTQQLCNLGLEAFRTMETLESRVDFNGKTVCFFSNADLAAPYQV